MVRLEGAVGGRTAAARVGVVDEIVVHEGGRVEDLERRRGGGDIVSRDGRGVIGLGDGAPSCETEAGSQSLASAERGRPGADEGDRLGSRSDPFTLASLDEPCQSLGNCRDRVGGRGHGPSLVLECTGRIECTDPSARPGLKEAPHAALRTGAAPAR